MVGHKLDPSPTCHLNETKISGFVGQIACKLENLVNTLFCKSKKGRLLTDWTKMSQFVDKEANRWVMGIGQADTYNTNRPTKLMLCQIILLCLDSGWIVGRLKGPTE